MTQEKEQSASVLGAPRRKPPSEHAAASPAAWNILAWTGLLLGVIGLTDLAMLWVPMQWSDPQWEFATVVGTMNGLPLPTLALLLLLAAGIARSWTKQVRLVAAVLVLGAVMILAVAAVWALTLPMALRSVDGSPAAVGMYKAVTKTTIQVVLYPALMLGAATYGWRAMGRRRSPSGGGQL